MVFIREGRHSLCIPTIMLYRNFSFVCIHMLRSRVDNLLMKSELLEQIKQIVANSLLFIDEFLHICSNG